MALSFELKMLNFRCLNLNTMKTLIYLFRIVVVVLFLFGCSSNRKNKADVKQQAEQLQQFDEEIYEDLGHAKRVFYSLPSPVETTLLLKRAEVVYNPELLNPIQNAVNYTTATKKALNFGVYGADLSYANLFSQTQTSIEYLATSKKLAEELGIMAFVDENIVQRLESNINNRDSSMEIITETFMSSSSQLKESGRPEIAALIIAGGWIEGLYLATSLTKDSPNNNELIDRIIDQKASLEILRSLLMNYEKSQNIAQTLDRLNEIKAVYDQIQVVTSKVEPVSNADEKITTLQAKTEIFVSQEVFSNLCHKADSVRNLIIGM